MTLKFDLYWSDSEKILWIIRLPVGRCGAGGIIDFFSAEDRELAVQLAKKSGY